MKVHRIQGIAFSSYLIETPDALFLIDSGFRWFERLITGKVRAVGRDLNELRLAVLTHPHIDHVGSVSALLDRTSFEVASHPAAVNALATGGRAYSPPTQIWTRAVEWLATSALPLLRLPAITPTVLAADGQRLDSFGLPGALYHTPGHSEWCVSVVLDDGTAFTGDLIIGKGHMTTRVSPPAMSVDPDGAITSMKKVLAAGAQRFMPAHGAAFGAEDVRGLIARLEAGQSLAHWVACRHNEGRPRMSEGGLSGFSAVRRPKARVGSASAHAHHTKRSVTLVLGTSREEQLVGRARWTAIAE